MLVSSATCWCVLLLDLAGHLVPSGPETDPPSALRMGGRERPLGDQLVRRPEIITLYRYREWNIPLY